MLRTVIAVEVGCVLEREHIHHFIRSGSGWKLEII